MNVFLKVAKDSGLYYLPVLAGTAPSAPVPRDLDNFWNALGTIIVLGLMKVKKRTFAPSCWYLYSLGSQLSLFV